MEFIKNFMQEEDGVTAIEYGLIAALIAIVIIVAVQGAGTSLNAMFVRICNVLASAVTTSGGTGAGTCGGAAAG